MLNLRSWATMSGVSMVLLLGGGCDGGGGSPTAPPRPGFVGLTSEVVAAMATAIDDEYRAETIYEGVIADFGDIAPFVNVIQAELRHSAAIANLYANRGLQAPANPWTLLDVPRFATVQEACAVAVQAEIDNIALYDGFLGLDLPADVRQVFENNRRASLQNHLPAFRNCA